MADDSAYPVGGRSATIVSEDRNRYLEAVPLMTIYGHEAVRDRLRDMASRRALPASLLFEGPRGIGKQQLALWLARVLLCENADEPDSPCGRCRACRMTAEVWHPDLHWFFPRERLKKNPDDIEEIRDDMATAVRERVENDGI